MMRMISLTLLILLSLTSCSGGGQSDLQRYVSKLKKTAPTSLPALPTFQQITPYYYSLQDERTPFQVSSQRLLQGDAPMQRNVKEKIEQYPLDSLKMVGSITRGTKVWALVKAPDDIVYQIKVGDYIGPDYGKVTKVTEKAIFLTQSMVKEGRWEQQPTEIRLPVTEMTAEQGKG
tara:strand:+ start:69742 stop:70266 length:525 start_codon:yes stop_codon:yes gene_type:complete